MAVTQTRDRLGARTGSVDPIQATAVVLLLFMAFVLPFALVSLGYIGLFGIVLAGALLASTIPFAFTSLSGTPTRAQRSGVHGFVEMALYLSPVLLLTAAFPLATQRILDIQVGGASLTSLLLACSVTVPWSSQAVCMPLYRAIGALIPEGNMDAIQRRFCQVWPSAFIQSLPTVAIFAVAMQLVMSWSWTAFATYFTLSVLHVAFAQSLVISNVGRLRTRWALGLGRVTQQYC